MADKELPTYLDGLSPPLTRDSSQERRPSTMHFTQPVGELSTKPSGCLDTTLVVLNGEDLRIADLVAVAKNGVKVRIDDTTEILDRLNRSVNALGTKLRAGELVYGVNTGFGGSADTRTSNLVSLQRALVQHQNSGILTRTDLSHEVSDLSDHDVVGSTSMPSSWVRGMMLARVNSLLRGHSAVSLPVVNAIVTLLNCNLTPVVPLRGSISASGDLQPLSYVAAVLQGNPAIRVRTGPGNGKPIITAPEALDIAGLARTTLAAKEGLGLLNGTAASAALASLTIHDANNLSLLSQALTAMAVEALAGAAESFDPFISTARPHVGQGNAAANMLSFLQGSKLVHGLLATDVDHARSGLCQDRYALRTSPQWIGPLLEDLNLATSQVNVELNSTTDNPLIDVADKIRILHGGNFQAASLTSAMEKTRNALQQLGKMLFAQSTEMNNPAMNRGLPPNLCADDPSLSFTCKGVDINMAAYASELGWLNHPVGPHVQSAEMHNQAINSLALLSGRATYQAVEVLSSMCAAFMFMVCQALDLRVLLVRFLEAVERNFMESTTLFLASAGVAGEDAQQAVTRLWTSLQETWNSSAAMDLVDRCNKTAETMTGQALIVVSATPTTSTLTQEVSLRAITDYKQTLATLLHTNYISIRSHLFADHLDTTPTYLGRAASRLYIFVRKDLGVPLFRGLEEDPTDLSVGAFPAVEEKRGRTRRTIGCWISIIYEAVRDGSLYRKLAEV